MLQDPEPPPPHEPKGNITDYPSRCINEDVWYKRKSTKILKIIVKYLKILKIHANTLRFEVNFEHYLHHIWNRMLQTLIEC